MRYAKDAKITLLAQKHKLIPKRNLKQKSKGE